MSEICNKHDGGSWFKHCSECYNEDQSELTKLRKENERLRNAIDKVRQNCDMLHDEHYDLAAWRDNHIVNEEIFDKALKSLEGKDE